MREEEYTLVGIILDEMIQGETKLYKEDSSAGRINKVVAQL